VADACNSSGRRIPNKIRLDDHIGEKDGIPSSPVSLFNAKT
jgi:hypothetical protein